MLVKTGEHGFAEVRTRAEPADDVMTRDFYTQLPQIRLSVDPTSRPAQPVPSAEVTLDGNDIATLVECAIRHPSANMRYAVLAAIWKHPDSFRQIFQFGLDAPLAFAEIRDIVAELLGKSAPAPENQASSRASSADGTLLPRMPLPAHLRGRTE